MKLLIVEDNKELLENTIKYLEKQGFICEHAIDYESGLKKIYNYEYDCAIIDITLPGGSGLNIVKKLKETNEYTGIIIISAKNSIDDKITGLDIGADDYLTKPFDIAELNARIKSVFRRKKLEGNDIIIHGKLEINVKSRTCNVDSKDLVLTPKEYDMLMYLASNKGRVISKQSIAEHICGDYMDMVSSLDLVYTHIKNLRKKLANAGIGDYIKSTYSIGYKFEINN